MATSHKPQWYVVVCASQLRCYPVVNLVSTKELCEIEGYRLETVCCEDAEKRSRLPLHHSLCLEAIHCDVSCAASQPLLMVPRVSLLLPASSPARDHPSNRRNPQLLFHLFVDRSHTGARSWLR